MGFSLYKIESIEFLRHTLFVKSEICCKNHPESELWYPAVEMCMINFLFAIFSSYALFPHKKI